jgi:post-segregation antitoxin (ccd killing protein)
MSKRVTVNVPDDVAERLGEVSNVSAYVTEAVRSEMAREETRRLLAEHGFPPISEEGLARARAKLDEVRSRMTPERYAELRRRGRGQAA